MIKQTLEEKILHKIKEKGMKQKPRWQFILHTVFLTSATIVALLVIFYLISFVSLVTREQDLIKIFGFGPKFTFTFLRAIPWMLLFLIFILLGVLQVLVRYFTFGYERTVLATLTATIFFTALISYGFYTVDKSMRFARFGERGEAPFLKPIHDKYRRGDQPNILHGIITEVEKESYSLETFRGSTTVIFITNNKTRKDPNIRLEVGESVFVVFERVGTTTQALFIKNNHKKPELR